MLQHNGHVTAVEADERTALGDGDQGGVVVSFDRDEQEISLVTDSEAGTEVI